MGDLSCDMTAEEKLAVAAEFILDAPFGELQEVCVRTCFLAHVGGIASASKDPGEALTVTSKAGHP